MFPAPNFTQVPNLVFDKMLAKMSESELKIFMVICRQTVGWHRQEHRISLSFLAKATGLARRSILRGIKEALERKTIIRRLSSDGKTYFYNVNIFFNAQEDTETEDEEPDPFDDDEVVQNEEKEEEIQESFSRDNLYIPPVSKNNYVGTNCLHGVGTNCPSKKERSLKEIPPFPQGESSAKAPASLRGKPPQGGHDPGNADEDLKKNFRKAFEEEEKVERALKYYKNFSNKLRDKKNPIGFVIYAIRTDEDLKELKNLEIIEQRKIWANRNARDSQGGYSMACRDGYEICSGTIHQFHAYEENDPFWEHYGLGFCV